MTSRASIVRGSSLVGVDALYSSSFVLKHLLELTAVL